MGSLRACVFVSRQEMKNKTFNEMQDASNTYEDIFYCLTFRLGEQDSLFSGEKQ